MVNIPRVNNTHHKAIPLIAISNRNLKKAIQKKILLHHVTKIIENS